MFESKWFDTVIVQRYHKLGKKITGTHAKQYIFIFNQPDLGQSLKKKHDITAVKSGVWGRGVVEVKQTM